MFQEYQGETRDLTSSAGGWAVLIVLTLLTGGAFLLAYILYDTFFNNRESGRAEVFATPEGAGMTRASVSANRRNLENTWVGWVNGSLRNDRAALRVAATADVQTNEEVASPVDEGDIPSQIRRLAELRDQGILTEEEFDSKKRDLLDRM